MINIGLLLIVLGWAYQAWSLFKKSKIIQPIFVGFYALGVLFLIIGISPFSLYNFLSLNGLSFIFSLIVLMLILKKN